MVAALQRMTVGELRRKWEEVHGEPARSYNKDYLWKRIAWRIQAEAEGGLPDEFRERAKELHREADIRVRPPKGTYADKERKPAAQKVRAPEFGRKRDSRLPVPGSFLTKTYRGQVITVTVEIKGFTYEGRRYDSLSAITKAVTGSNWNGYNFFGLGKAGVRSPESGGQRPESAASGTQGADQPVKHLGSLLRQGRKLPVRVLQETKAASQ
jgi:hypothetical protein